MNQQFHLGPGGKIDLPLPPRCQDLIMRAKEAGKKVRCVQDPPVDLGNRKYSMVVTFFADENPLFDFTLEYELLETSFWNRLCRWLSGGR